MTTTLTRGRIAIAAGVLVLVFMVGDPLGPNPRRSPLT